MTHKKQVMSIAIEPDLQSELKEYCRQKDVSVSKYVGMLVAKGVKIPVDDEPIVVGRPADTEVLPVVLTIPANLKGNAEELRAWMEVRVNGIIAKLCG
jgi:hypothetical protein